MEEEEEKRNHLKSGYLGKTMEIRERKKKPCEEWLFGKEDGNKRKKKEITSGEKNLFFFFLIIPRFLFFLERYQTGSNFSSYI